MFDRDHLRARRLPYLLAAVFGAVTIITVLIAASTSTTAFGVYNTAWDGATELRSVAETTGADAIIAQDTAEYTTTDPNTTAAVILAPDHSYAPVEQERLSTFVQNGGTLVVADDYGNHSNTLLAAVGAHARLDGRPLRDERYHYRSPAMPTANNVSTHPLTTNISALTLNHGTAVQPNTATPLVRTSGYAYLDTNQNTDLDGSEHVTTYPVVTQESSGAGTVIVVGDPSIFINAMLDRSGNRRFVQQLFAQHQHVLLDYSHTAELPPLAFALLILRDSPLIQFIGGAGGVLTIFIARRTDLISRVRGQLETAPASETPPTIPDDELAAYLRSRYPEWDDDRIQHIVETRTSDS